MEDKEIEKILKEGADNIEVREFSLVWDDIKSKINPPKKKRYRLLPVVASVVSIVVACSIIIPVALWKSDNPVANEKPSSGSSEQIYFSDELLLLETMPEDFVEQLSLASIDIIDIDKYVISSSYLFKTPEQTVKGGRLELTDNLENSTFYLTVDLYDISVKLENNLTIEYEFEYTFNNIVVEYRIKESYPEDNVYIYDIKTIYNVVNYIMVYTCFTEDIRPFLEDFFN